jgi:ferritin-like metal-binding protein YciE
VRYAKELGHADIAKKLQKTLDEGYKADEKLNKMVENRLNKKAE